MRIFFWLMFFISLSLSARTIEVMSYNVENLFDAKHDVFLNQDKKDWSFLPKNYPRKKEECLKEKKAYRQKECLASNWTETKVDLKISQITDVISRNRSLPEFLGLVEVENNLVVGKLAKKLGYDNFVMCESPDERGIDVALLYKKSKDIKKISRAEHIVNVDYPTRNILEVEFLISGKYPITFFVNHWPSLANPDSWRIKAAEVLVERIRVIIAKNPQMAIIALGDFNTIDENNPHPFKAVLFKDNLLFDVNQSEKPQKAPGTYYFAPKDQWNNLDHFFVNDILLDHKKLDLVSNSFEIYSPNYISKVIKKKSFKGEMKDYKLLLAPNRFNPKGKTRETMGYSDHYPITLKLDFPNIKF